MSTVLLTRSRGDALEAEHLGCVAVVDHTGQVVFSAGDIDRPFYPRSAIKLIHALPFLKSGAASVFNCSDQEITLAAASHSGDDQFVEILRAWAERLGVDEPQLICGPDTPLSPRVAQRLIRGAGPAHVFHNNNVGKHLAIITTCLHLGEPIEGYERPEHPAQQRIAQTVKALCEIETEANSFAVDNCGLPTFQITTRTLALGMARLGAAAHENPVSAAARLISAIRAQPEFLGGPKRLVTQLLKMTGGQVIVKGGSEGVFTVSVPAEGLGIALKVHDGSGEASSAILVEFLSRYGLLPQGAIQPLQQRVNVWHRAETPDRSPRLEFPAFSELLGPPAAQAMLLPASGRATMPTGIHTHENFNEEDSPRFVDTPFKYGIIRHRNLPDDTLLPFIDYATESVEKVSAYLDVPLINDMIIQLVGRHSRSMTILDEKRIRISEHKLPNETCLLHELTHLLMGPSPLGDLFTEGLAVHVQAILNKKENSSVNQREYYQRDVYGIAGKLADSFVLNHSINEFVSIYRARPTFRSAKEK